MDSHGAAPPATRPSRMWYVGHVFFGLVSGLVCFLVWKDDNRRAANRHLVHSIWIPVAAWAAVCALAWAAAPGLQLDAWDPVPYPDA